MGCGDPLANPRTYGGHLIIKSGVSQWVQYAPLLVDDYPPTCEQLTQVVTSAHVSAHVNRS